jgi:hypothetical protein
MRFGSWLASFGVRHRIDMNMTWIFSHSERVKSPSTSILPLNIDWRGSPLVSFQTRILAMSNPIPAFCLPSQLPHFSICGVGELQ